MSVSMLLYSNSTSLISSVYDTAISAFKNGAKDIANSLLMNLIFTLKNQDNDLKNILFDLEKNPTISITLDTDEYQDILINLEYNFEKLLCVSKKYKDKSDVFMEFYKISDSLYGHIILLGNEVSAVASEQRYEESKIAS